MPGPSALPGQPACASTAIYVPSWRRRIGPNLLPPKEAAGTDAGEHSRSPHRVWPSRRKISHWMKGSELGITQLHAPEAGGRSLLAEEVAVLLPAHSVPMRKLLHLCGSPYGWWSQTSKRWEIAWCHRKPPPEGTKKQNKTKKTGTESQKAAWTVRENQKFLDQPQPPAQHGHREHRSIQRAQGSPTAPG